MATLTTFLQPRVLWIYFTMYADVASAQALMWFDAMLSFSIAFAVAYGTLSLAGKIVPAAPGARPRVWVVPLLFFAVLGGYCLFFDQFVSAVFGGLRDYCGGLPSWLPLRPVACLWLGGAVVMLARAARGAWTLSRVVNQLPPCPPNPLSDRAMAVAGLSRSVSMKTGPAHSPVVSLGSMRPRIIVPENFAARYGEEERYSMLLHECVHIKNHDTAKLFCLAALKAFFWFDPVVRHAIGRMQTEMELLCDWTLVQGHRLDRDAYAALIMKAASGQRAADAAAGFSDTYRLIARRLGHILHDGEAFLPSRVSRRIATLLLTALLCVVAAASVVYAGRTVPKPIQPGDFLHPQTMEILDVRERHGILGSWCISWSSTAPASEK